MFGFSGCNRRARKIIALIEDEKKVHRFQDVHEFVSVISDKIKRGANLKYQDANGDTPLHHAVRRENTSLILNLLICTRQCGMNIHNYEGMTPLHIAISSGNSEAVEILLENGSNPFVEIQKDMFNLTPLQQACDIGSEKIIKDILKAVVSHGGGPNEITDALYHAVIKGRDDVVKLLIDTRLACLNSHTEERDTPLCLAFMNGFLSTAKLLIKSGADLSLCHDYMIGYICFTYLTSFESVERDIEDEYIITVDWGPIIRYLIEKGFDPNTPYNGKYPLECAVETINVSMTEALVSSPQIDLTVQFDNQETILFKAVRNGHRNIITILLNKGADPTATNKRNETADIVSSAYGFLLIA